MAFFGLFTEKSRATGKVVQAANAGLKPPPPPPPPVLLCRYEIVDARQRLVGYRFRLEAAEGAPPVTEDDYIAALERDDVRSFAARRLCLVQLSPEALAQGRHQPLLAPELGFEFDRRALKASAAQLAAVFSAVREEGAKSLLQIAAINSADHAALAAADIVVIDLAQTALPQFQRMLRQLRTEYPKLQIAVDQVSSWDEQRMCLHWGAHYCMGPFLSQADKLDENGKIDQGRLTSIELLNLLRADAEVDALSAVAKRDPGLSFQLLKWANAPSNGLATPITSLTQAIVVLGRAALYRWLTVSMFRLGSANRARDESLLEVALTRARFLELVAEGNLNAAQRDELFLIGLLSLFDVLLGIPMPHILNKMHLSEAVQDVLLRSQGAYSPYLMLALQLERGQVQHATETALRLRIDPHNLHATSHAAFLWAQESLQHTLGD